jgi:RNA polymerase sigma factor (sigma-70 family)
LSDGAFRAFANHIRTAVSRTAAAAATDRELLARFADARDESAFAFLVTRYGRLVRNVCRNILRDEHDAEEAMQATFLLLARRAAALRHWEVLAGWLHGVAYRTALRARRDIGLRRAREASVCSVRTSPPDPVDEAAWRELQAILDEELQRLPERLRTPFALCCLGGYGHGEAARRLGWKTGTVSSRLAEARQLLQRRLARRGVSLSAVLGGLALAGEGARAGLPTPLVAKIVTAARQFVGGGEAGPAGRLAGDALREELGRRVKFTVAVAAALGALAIGVGVGLGVTQTHPDRPELAAVSPAAPARAGRPRLDPFGDALPDDAVARLGPNRFSHDWFTESTVWSPDGKVIASLGGGSTARPLCLFDAATGRQLHQLPAQGPVASAAFSPDGKTLAAAEGKRGVVLWDVVSGKERDRVTGRGDAVAVAFAPDGRTLAVACRGGVIQVREAAGGRPVVELNMPGEAQPRKVAYAPDGRSLAATGDGGTVILWDLAAGAERWSKKPHGQWALGLAFAPDGRSLATTGGDGSVRIWDTGSGNSLASCDHGLERGMLIAYSPDGRVLAGPGAGGSVCLWDPVTGKEIRRWPTRESLVLSVSYSPDGRVLATTGLMGSRVRLWDAATVQELHRSVRHNALVYGLTFSPDGGAVWSAGGEGDVIRWDVASGEGRPLHGACADGEFHPAAVARDGRTVAVGGADGSVHLWDAGGQHPATPGRHDRSVMSTAFSPDGKLLATTGTDRTLRLWDVATRREQCRVDMPPGKWGCLSISPDGRQVAVSRGQAQGEAPAPRVLDVQTGEEIFRLESPPPAPGVPAAAEEFVRFSPDGKTLATVGSCRDSVARLWDAATGRLIGRCGGETQCLLWYCLAFSPDGRLLATGPYDHDDAIHLWEVATFQEVARLEGHHGGVTALTFSPDGRVLASGGGDATVLLWDLTGRAAGGNRAAGPLSPSRLEKCWQDLGGEDAPAAYRAVRALAADPGRSVPFISRRLWQAEPAAAEWPRQCRAVMALEYAATPGAQQLLQTLAGAGVEPRLAEEARAALGRLDRSP